MDAGFCSLNACWRYLVGQDTAFPNFVLPSWPRPSFSHHYPDSTFRPLPLHTTRVVSHMPSRRVCGNNRYRRLHMGHILPRNSPRQPKIHPLLGNLVIRPLAGFLFVPVPCTRVARQGSDLLWMSDIAHPSLNITRFGQTCSTHTPQKLLRLPPTALLLPDPTPQSGSGPEYGIVPRCFSGTSELPAQGQPHPTRYTTIPAGIVFCKHLHLPGAHSLGPHGR
ncbi:hypothetical protein V8F33_005381 [Rhypophila sp. PSN 637]